MGQEWVGRRREQNVRVGCNIDIGGSPTKLPSVGGEHEDIEACLPRALQQRDCL